MPHPVDQKKDTGLACLLLVARLHGVAVDPEQLRHQHGTPGEPLTTLRILRAAKSLGLKAKEVRSDPSRLDKLQLPAIAEHTDGRYFVLAKAAKDKVLIQDPLEATPQTLPLELLKEAWSGRLILFARRAGISGEKRHFDFSWFVPAIVKYRHLFGEVLLASFFLQIFALITPLFFQVVVDKVLVHRSLSTLEVLAIGMMAVSLFEVVLGGLRTYLFAHTTNRIDVELGAGLYRHLLALPLAYFQARRVGDSVARVRELENIRNFITGSALTLVIDIFFTVVFIAVMFYYSPLLTLVVLGTIPFYIAISLYATPILRAKLHEKFNRGAENQAFLVESVTGIETIKAMAVEPRMRSDWENQLAAYVKAAFAASHHSNIASQAAQFINKVMFVLFLWFGARLVITGELSIGALVALNMLSQRVSGPVLRLVQLWQDFQQAGISIQRLGDILNTQCEPQFNPARSSLPELRGRVTLEHVVFRYRPDAPPVLQGVSLDVAAGETIGIVGRSGSGKSTLTKLIQRLQVPEAGRVMVDGVDLSLVEPAWLRRNIGVVLQENYLFNKSVRDNIALADPGLPMDRIVAAAKLAGAHEFIVELPEGYDAVVGERGATLSGGQRQRIAIARALIGNPKILIFDEATSALDYESEAIIQRNMRAITRGRTVFIIAHRLSTVRHCDRIIVLDHGRIVEQGTHEALASQNGIYTRLHAMQSADRTATATAPRTATLSPEHGT